jgi:hypothetical protein
MALEIVWSDEANEGPDEIIEYLEENWTKKEIHHFFYPIGSVSGANQRSTASTKGLS